MKQVYYKLIVVCVMICAALAGNAQLSANPVYIETIIHNGDYGEPGHDLSGYATYKVYLQFDDPENYLTAIFAYEAPTDCTQDIDSVVHFEFPCGLFQHEQGNDFGFGQSCLYNLDIFPTTLYDSYLTIGQECTSQITCDFINYVGQCPEWFDNFNGPSATDYFDGGDFFWDEGAVFAAPCFQPYPTSLSHADANGRVLIGQFTSCGDMSGCINITYEEDNGGANNIDHTELNVCFEAQMPCLAQALDTIPSIIEGSCGGDLTSVEIEPSGNGPVDYTLYKCNDVFVSEYLNQEGLNISPIAPGCYYIAMIDSIGCRDTTSVFSINAPQGLSLNVVQTSGVLCNGDLTGAFDLNCSGGSGLLSVSVNGTNYPCGTTVSNLACGIYNFILTDQNDCSVDTTITIPCPPAIVFNPIVTNIQCYGDDDGSIVGSIIGGTQPLEAVWTYNSAPDTVISGSSPLSINLQDLDGGIYAVTITDQNNCTSFQEFTITEPALYTAVSIVENASCFSICDGSIAYNISGGTSPYVTTGILIGGNVANLNALCDGEYAITITDNAGCQILDTLTITEPTDIFYTLNTVQITCFGQCDAEIELSDVNGSNEGFTYTLSPATAPCVAPCSGSQANFEQVCAGIYSVTITDQTGCPKVVNGISIVSPQPLEIVLTPHNVTCFGFQNGEIDIDHIGGTPPFVVIPGNLSIPVTVSNLSPGNYTYTLTDSNGCFSTSDTIITQPQVLVVTITNTDDVKCGGDVNGLVNYAVTGGTSPYEYHLTPGGLAGLSNGTISGLAASDYELAILDIYNCADTTTFSINEPEPLSITTLLDAPTCTGTLDGSAELQLNGGTGALTLFISPKGTESIQADSVTYELTGLGESQLYFQLQDESNCIFLDTLDIVPDIISDMVFTVFTSPETCWNEHNGTATIAVQNGNPPISYQWDDANAQTTATAMGLPSNQEFIVIVTDAIGCTLSDTAFVEPTVGCFFIATAITPNGDGANDKWILGGLEYYSDCKVNVYNRWGQNVFTSTGYSFQWDGTFQGQLLPVADYYFTIDYSPDEEVILGTVTIKY